MNYLEKDDMIAAKEEIDAKFEELQDFFDSPEYDALSDEMRTNLSQQYSGYHTLSGLLDQYIGFFP